MNLHHDRPTSAAPRPLPRVLIPNNTRRPSLSRRCNALLTAALLGTTASLLAAPPAHPAPSTPPPPPVAAPTLATPIDAGLAQSLFPVVENWIKRGSTPAQTLSLPVTGLCAVDVTLRQGGSTLAQASTSAPDVPGVIASSAAPVDVMALLRRAADQAIAEARATLGEPISQANPPLALDLQFAGVPVPIHVARLDELPRRITLGVDGLAMQRGSKWAWVMPGTAIASNTNLRGTLNRLLAGLDYPLEKLPAIGTAGGPPLYRVPAFHVTRTGADHAVTLLYRGDIVLPATPLDQAQLSQLAQNLRDHLLHRQRRDGRFYGEYQPTADRFSPLLANEADSALAAYVLGQASKIPDLDAKTKQAANDAALRTIAWLTSRLGPQPEGSERSFVGSEAQTSAMTLLAILSTPDAGDVKDQRLQLAAAFRGMQQPEGLMRATIQPGSRAASITAQAVSAAAMVALYDRTRDPQVLQQAQSLLAAIWPQVTTDRLPLVMPWLEQAELELSRLGKPTATLGRVAPAIEPLWKLQVRPADPGDTHRPSPDTIGGFLLGDSLMNEPTCESSPILAAMAMAMRDPSIVPAPKRPAWLVDCALGARFVAQLTMKPAGCYYTRRPDLAVGGTRVALWNNHEPLQLTAMSLLAITQIQQSLAAGN